MVDSYFEMLRTHLDKLTTAVSTAMVPGAIRRQEPPADDSPSVQEKAQQRSQDAHFLFQGLLERRHQAHMGEIAARVASALG